MEISGDFGEKTGTGDNDDVIASEVRVSEVVDCLASCVVSGLIFGSRVAEAIVV